MKNAPEQSENEITDEVERLQQILLALNRMTDEERLRVFEYLKSKYSTSWPSE